MPNITINPKIRCHKQASQDLENTLEVMARTDSEAARRFGEILRQSVRTLTQNPGVGQAGRVNGTRELHVGDTTYVIPYRVRDSVIEIIGLFQSREY